MKTSSELNSTGISADEVDIEDETVDGNDDTNAGIENVFEEAAPTYEEALGMEAITENEIRRRVSSRQSLKSDDPPDYDYIDNPVYSDE